MGSESLGPLRVSSGVGATPLLFVVFRSLIRRIRLRHPVDMIDGAFKSSFQVIKTLSDHPHEDLFQIFVSHFEILFLMRTVHPSSLKV